MPSQINSYFTFLENFDQYAPPIRMTYKGKETHQTKCGGLLTIIFYTALTTFFYQRLLILINYGQDEFQQSKIFYNEEENYFYLSRDLLDFQISFIGSGNAPNFD